MLRKNNTSISAALRNDFGIEDFQANRVTSSMANSFGLEDVKLSNSLGLLSPIADKYDTDVVSFGAEAYDLLGEAKQLEQFSEESLDSLNERFAIAADIKKSYGVENFDPFAYGCEGFGEAIKQAFTAVVAAIKKVIQSISNWIRQVMNWTGSQFAKLQQKLVDTYGNKKMPASQAMVKVILPPAQIDSGTTLIKEVSNSIEATAKTVAKSNENIVKQISNGANKDINAAVGNLNKQLKPNILLTTYYGKKLDVIKLGSAKLISNGIVWGVEKPSKVEFNAAEYISKKVNWKNILSKNDLKAAQELVKNGKALIKVMNETLKTANSVSKTAITMTSNQDTKEQKKAMNAKIKTTRGLVSTLNNNCRLGSLFAGILYGTFANYLKLRSYTASCVKAVYKGSEKTNKKGSNADRMNKARSAVYN